MRIGVVGSGRVGAMLGELWLRAGHQIMFSDKDPMVLKALRARLPRARFGSSLEAVRFGEAVLLSVPYSAMPDISRDLGGALRGKVVIDTGNPIADRDGELGRAALARGSGLATAGFLPAARVVRGFNAISVPDVGRLANRPGAKAGILLASDNASALAVTRKLVHDAGFDPVVVGGLASASRFEKDSPAFGPKTAAELRAILRLRS